MKSMLTPKKTIGLMSFFFYLCLPCGAATIVGKVKGLNGSAPFRGAFVQAQNTKTKITVSVLSDLRGNYQVEKLPAGDYEIHVRAVDYKSAPLNTLKNPRG